jgi:hypothetical protein
LPVIPTTGIPTHSRVVANYVPNATYLWRDAGAPRGRW